MNRREACLVIAAGPAAAADFESRWPSSVERPWIGPEFWANPLQDWRLKNGRIECHVAGGDRNVYLLTHEISAQPGAFQMRCKLGPLEEQQPADAGFAGFRVGIRGFFNDYRDSAVYGTGINAGVDAQGTLFIGRVDGPKLAPGGNIELLLESDQPGMLRLRALDSSGKMLAVVERSGLDAGQTAGGVALVCSSVPPRNTPDPAEAAMTMSGVNKRDQQRGGSMRYWFRDWKLSGNRVVVHPGRTFGPILWSMYTLHRGVLKLSAQFAPVAAPPAPAQLQTRDGAGWKTIASSPVDPAARTAVFRVTGWDATRDTPYRVLYRMDGEHTWEGTIRRDPVDKPRIVVAGLSCNNDLGFPHADVVSNVRHFQPDLLAFTGDQIYERCAGYGIERQPVERATLDYLRKWYLFGWEYRELLKDIPSVSLPDDHDVFHGNLWGASGRRAEGTGQPGQDSGGYTQPAAWVNMVQRTQTGHMPDPYDPTPVQQDIGVYYCALDIGGVSFAIIEDRKWKSPPRETLPAAGIVNGWARNPGYDAAKQGDAAGAQLLGERQLRFLNEWAQDWSRGIWMKAVISQTIFCNVATLPPPADTDAVTPKLPVEPPGGYAQGEVKVADHDSNGWPQTPRNEALRAMRRCFAFHIAGDQHLGSTVQYGIDDWNDASWAICVPAVANIFPRRWYPQQPGRNPKPHSPRNTGEYLDGFGNKVTIHAIFNPQAVAVEPRPLNQRAPGYGIVEFDRASRKITVANWARWTDAAKPGARPVEGWPLIIDQTANGLPRGWALAPLRRPGRVIQVVAEDGAVVYTYRMGREFTPGVPAAGTYRVRLLDESGKVVEETRVVARKA